MDNYFNLLSTAPNFERSWNGQGRVPAVDLVTIIFLGGMILERSCGSWAYQPSGQSDVLACPCLAVSKRLCHSSKSGQPPQAESSRLLNHLASRWVCQWKVHVQQKLQKVPCQLGPRKKE